MAQFLSKLCKAKSDRKYQSYNRQISMDRKAKYPRFVQYKKPQKKPKQKNKKTNKKQNKRKTPIKREITIFADVSKVAIFRQIAKMGPLQNFKQWLNF